LRPIVSARRPVEGEKRRAKNEVELVMRDLSSVVRGRAESELWIDMRVEEITPVLGFGLGLTRHRKRDLLGRCIISLLCAG
jgi:hypothetical protein